MIKPLVSVIMPVYNAEAFVAEAIESVLAQTYPHWELIIVDDGSTDASPEILKRYTDPRIVTIRQQNKGEGGARNTGLERAKGETIGFLDADDAYLPTALADFVEYLHQHREVDVAYADGYYCDELLRPLRRFSECRLGTHEGRILEPLVLSPVVVSPTLGMAVRRAQVEAGHVRFDESLRYGVDWDFWIQLAQQARYGNLPKLIGRYRLHATSMTRGATQRALNEKLVPGRLKVLHAAWFNDLSLPTRQRFFYYLLIGLLGDDPGRQAEILRDPQFDRLPEAAQAQLLRLVASDHLRSRIAPDFARQCLERAHEIFPDDRKTALLMRLVDMGAPACSAVLSTWGVLSRTQARLRSIGRKGPKPVPMAPALIRT